MCNYNLKMCFPVAVYAAHSRMHGLLWIVQRFVRVVFALYEPQPLANATKRGMGSANSCYRCCSGTKATPITRMIKPEPLGTSSYHWDWRAKCKTNCICATIVQHCSEKPFLFSAAVRFIACVVSAQVPRPSLVVRRRPSLLRCNLLKELSCLMQMCHFWGSKRERGSLEHQIRLS